MRRHAPTLADEAPHLGRELAATAMTTLNPDGTVTSWRTEIAEWRAEHAAAAARIHAKLDRIGAMLDEIPRRLRDDDA